MDSSSTVREQAGRWLMRRESEAWSPGDEAALKAWLESSTAHVVQFIRLEAAWKQAGRLNSLAADVAPRTVPAANHWDRSPFFDWEGSAREPSVKQDVQHRWRRLGGLAAGLALIAAGAVSWRIWLAEPAYSTPVGGLASVPMTDGSKITLNTASKVRVRISESERQIALEQGEAYFEVAKDSARPFIVVAGNRRVEVLGTAFSVRRMQDGIQVAVTEGLLRGGGPEGRMLPAGSVARTEVEGLTFRELSLSEVQELLSWRTGYLVFDGTPLGEAVAELNRYNAQQIVLSDPSIASIRLTGKFESTRCDAFVRLLESGFSLRSQRRGDRIVLSHE